MSSHLPLLAGILYLLLGGIPATIAYISWGNREKPGAVPLVVTGLGAGSASVVQGLRFVEESVGAADAVAVLLHILLLASINIAVLGTLYIAVEYTNKGWLMRRWLVAALAVAGVGLPVARLLTETASAESAALFADADFLYRLVLAVAGLSFFARQLFAVRGVYRKQTAALLFGLAIGSGLGLVERFYTVVFVEFTLLGMSGGCVILAVALFRFEFLETAPVARETLFNHVSDPVIALDGSGHVADINQTACKMFGLSETLVGTTVETMFQTDSGLAARYEEAMNGREPIGGIVADGRRHFDSDHPVIAAMLTGQLVGDTEDELAILTDGEVKYYTVTSTELELSPSYRGQLVVFRETTAERERTQELDVLKQVLTRVLRHNLRNEVTVIRGFASSIAERSDGEVQTNAERIVGRTETLVKTSETARSIKKVIDADEAVPIFLPDLVDRAVDTASENHPDAAYERSVADVTVSVNPEFDIALAEVVENAIVHNDSQEKRVRITAEELDSRVELTVSDNGPGIPEHELDVLDQREETSLVHGSGAGLWLVQTAVESSNGSVTYDTSDDGTAVQIRLPLA